MQAFYLVLKVKGQGPRHFIYGAPGYQTLIKGSLGMDPSYFTSVTGLKGPYLEYVDSQQSMTIHQLPFEVQGLGLLTELP